MVNGDRPASNRPPYDLYIASMVAALLSILMDRQQNAESSAIRKVGHILMSTLEISTDSTSRPATIAALLLIVFIAGFMVFIYSPKERKEAFILGLGVLGFVTVNVPSSARKELHVSSDIPGTPVTSTVIGPAQRGWSALIPSAHAQPATLEQAAPNRSRIWIFVNGPTFSGKNDMRVILYDATGTIVHSATTSPSFMVEQPYGKYRAELSHYGFKSISFALDANASTNAYSVVMTKTGADFLDNLFGPDNTKVKNDPVKAAALEKAQTSCKEGRSAEAKALVKDFPSLTIRFINGPEKYTLCR